MDNNFIKIYRNPKYQAPSKAPEVSQNSLEDGVQQSPKNAYSLSSPFQDSIQQQSQMLEQAPSKAQQRGTHTIKKDFYEVLPPFQAKKMYTLNEYSSGIGEVKIRVDSLQPVRLAAMIELKNGGQFLLPNDSIKRWGVSINSNTTTINLSHIKKIKRLSIITLDNINGVMVTENATLDWVKATQLNNIHCNTILLNIYNIFGKMVIREGLEYYSQNLRELAFYNSYKKINWLDENTPINNSKEF